VNRNRALNMLPYIIVMIAMMSLLLFTSNSQIKQLNYNEFMELVRKDVITEADVSVSNVVIDIRGKYTENGNEVVFKATIANTEVQNNQLIEELVANGVTVKIINPYESNLLVDTLVQIVPFLLFGAFAFFLLTRMNSGNNNKAFEFGKTRARLEGNIKVRFDDVAGCDEEKRRNG
jgi:cell division protease FtsH